MTYERPNVIEKNKLRHVNIIAHVSLGASFAKLTIFTTTPLEEEKDKGEGKERRTKREKEKAKEGGRGIRRKEGGKNEEMMVRISLKRL